LREDLSKICKGNRVEEGDKGEKEEDWRLGEELYG
jgi:hypothetical protein